MNRMATLSHSHESSRTENTDPGFAKTNDWLGVDACRRLIRSGKRRYEIGFGRLSPKRETVAPEVLRGMPWSGQAKRRYAVGYHRSGRGEGWKL